MTIKAPIGKFIVIAQLTEGEHKGQRYQVKPHWNDATRSMYPNEGKSIFPNTIEEARERIRIDKREMSRSTDASGLINWGTSSPRDYAIFPVTFGEAVE